MDRSLLQTEDEAAVEAIPRASANNDEVTPEPATDEATAYRELEVDAAQSPWRLKLEPPIEFDGQKYSQLVFDYDAMNGKDFQRVERTFTRLYKAERNEFVMPETKHLFHSLLAAQVADVPIGLILKLPRRYYIAVRNSALKACGSSSEEEKA
jgi:hypothetical protein